MALAFAIYMIGILHSIDSSGWVFALALGFGVFSFIKVGFKHDQLKAEDRENFEPEWNAYAGKVATKWFSVVAAAVCIAWLAPDKETSYTMLAAYGVSEAYEFASENEDVQRIATKSLKLIEKHLDDYTENMDNETQDTQTEGAK